MPPRVELTAPSQPLEAQLDPIPSAGCCTLHSRHRALRIFFYAFGLHPHSIHSSIHRRIAIWFDTQQPRPILDHARYGAMKRSFCPP